jgi:hypothetical protein
MSPLFIFYIVAVIIIVGIAILFSLKQFTPYASQTVATQTFLTTYSIPSPWTSAIPVQGIPGKCGVYTFTGVCNPPVPCNNPPVISLATVDNAIVAGYVTGPDLLAACTDSDQVFMRQVQHSCLFQKAGKIGPQAVGCVKQDGTYANTGDIETFWQLCQPGAGSGSSTGETQTVTANQGLCTGSISGVGFGYTGSPASNPQPATPFCMKSPVYSVNSKSQGQFTSGSSITFATCDLGEHDVNNYPDQLFRVERAFYSQGKFKPGNSGYYTRIIHRPSGNCVAPQFVTINSQPQYGNPKPGKPLQYIPCSSNSNSGYWWMISPTLAPAVASAPVIVGATKTSPGWSFNPSAYPQLVYVNDPTEISPNLGSGVLWELLTTITTDPVTKVKTPLYYSVGLDSATAPTKLQLNEFLVYDAGVPTPPPSDYTCSPPNTATCNSQGINVKYTEHMDDLATANAAQGAAFQYFDYSIYNLIISEPTVFSF